MSCQGKPIEMRDLRTPEQQQILEKMGPLLWGMMGKGATAFGGAGAGAAGHAQLSAPPDPSMLQAMNMMSQVGGQGPYTFPGMQTGAYPPASTGMNLPPWNYDWTPSDTGDTNGDTDGDTISKDELYDPNSTRRKIKRDELSPGYKDPYAPSSSRRTRKPTNPSRTGG